MVDAKEKQAEPLLVALCREADDLRSLHKVIGVKLGEEPWKYWDAGGVSLTSAVENLLGACGFAGKKPPVPEVRVLAEEELDAIPLIGFTVPAARYGSVRQSITRVATGQIGGFVPVLVAQSGYHDAAIDVFAYVWSRVDRPPIWVRRPPMGGRGGGDVAPMPILSRAGDDVSMRASQYIRSLLAR